MATFLFLAFVFYTRLVFRSQLLSRFYRVWLPDLQELRSALRENKRQRLLDQVRQMEYVREGVLSEEATDIRAPRCQQRRIRSAQGAHRPSRAAARVRAARWAARTQAVRLATGRPISAEGELDAMRLTEAGYREVACR